MVSISVSFLRSLLSNEREKEEDLGRDEFLSSIALDGKISFSSKEGGDIHIFYVETGGSEDPFLKIYKQYKPPYYLLVSGHSNSLASALEILSFLKGSGLSGEIIGGEIPAIRKSIERLAEISKERELLASSSLGIIGKPSDWLISSGVDHALAKRVFGLEMIDIPMDELLLEVNKHSYPKNEVPSSLLIKKANPQTLEGALNIYGALLRIIKKYRLSGFSLRCFDLLGSLKNTACLALALLNSQGYSAGCEGDETSLISMHILRCLGVPSFQCNPASIDNKNNSIVLAHCTLPLTMVGDDYEFMSHFESGLGIGIRGRFKKDDVTVFKMKSDLSTYHLWEGHIEENLASPCMCRSQIRVKLNEPITPLLKDPYGNHLLLCYKKRSEELKSLLASYGIF